MDTNKFRIEVVINMPWGSDSCKRVTLEVTDEEYARYQTDVAAGKTLIARDIHKTEYTIPATSIAYISANR